MLVEMDGFRCRKHLGFFCFGGSDQAELGLHLTALGLHVSIDFNSFVCVLKIVFLDISGHENDAEHHRSTP